MSNISSTVQKLRNVKPPNLFKQELYAHVLPLLSMCRVICQFPSSQFVVAASVQLLVTYTALSTGSNKITEAMYYTEEFRQQKITVMAVKLSLWMRKDNKNSYTAGKLRVLHITTG